MPRLGEDVTQFKTVNAYTFSGVKAEELEASEYTLVTIVQDKSGSVYGFKDEMINCLKTVLEACKKDPRSENLMIRLVTFNSRLREVHGFRILSSIDPPEYDSALDDIGGTTALYDGTHTAVDASLAYGRSLTEQGILVNAVVFVVTDGCDNDSSFAPSAVKEIVQKAMKDESVESVQTILIGITDGNEDVKKELKTFSSEAQLDQFVDIEDADHTTLAKLAQFVSQSISSQSQALGTGGASKPLTF